MPIRRRNYKRNARKSYVPSIYRRRAPATKYMRVALDFISQVGKTTGYVYEVPNSNIWTVASMLENATAWNNYAKVFSFAKLNSLAVTVTPSSTCNTDVSNAFYVCVAYMARVGENPSLDNVRENPTCMVLSPLQKTYKYINLCGNTGDWETFDYQNFDGRMVVASNVNPTVTAFHVWTIKGNLKVKYKVTLIVQT